MPTDEPVRIRPLRSSRSVLRVRVVVTRGQRNIQGLGDMSSTMPSQGHRETDDTGSLGLGWRDRTRSLTLADQINYRNVIVKRWSNLENLVARVRD